MCHIKVAQVRILGVHVVSVEQEKIESDNN